MCKGACTIASMERNLVDIYNGKEDIPHRALPKSTRKRKISGLETGGSLASSPTQPSEPFPDRTWWLNPDNPPPTVSISSEHSQNVSLAAAPVTELSTPASSSSPTTAQSKYPAALAPYMPEWTAPLLPETTRAFSSQDNIVKLVRDTKIWADRVKRTITVDPLRRPDLDSLLLYIEAHHVEQPDFGPEERRQSRKLCHRDRANIQRDAGSFQRTQSR